MTGTPMTPRFEWTKLAASAYQAYAASTGNKNFRGEPMPAFDALPVPIQTAWEAAVRHVGDCFERGEPLPDPARWEGWVRPQDRHENYVTVTVENPGFSPADVAELNRMGEQNMATLEAIQRGEVKAEDVTVNRVPWLERKLAPDTRHLHVVADEGAIDG